MVHKLCDQPLPKLSIAWSEIDFLLQSIRFGLQHRSHLTGVFVVFKRIRKGDEQLDQNGFRQDGKWPEREFCFGQDKS